VSLNDLTVCDFNACTPAMAIHVRMLSLQIYKADSAGCQCIDELEDYQVLQWQHGFVPILDSGRSTVLKPDSLIPPKVTNSERKTLRIDA
jgi:hypothetical protein